MPMELWIQKWKLSVLYLASILALLHLLHTRLVLDDGSVRAKRNPDLPLRFRSDGTFKILQVADMHYGNGILTSCRDVPAAEFRYCSDLNTTLFLKKMIESEKPDFIAFTGDNIFGSSTPDAAESLFKAFGPAMESRIPWAAILGNHDQESSMTREELMSLISLMDYSTSQINPPAKDPSHSAKGRLMEDIDGFGNYNLNVHGAPGSLFANSSILNLYFLDSGDRAVVKGVRTYGWIRESQLTWLRGVSQGFQGQKVDLGHSKDDLVTATPTGLVFFHIPIPEIRQLWYKEITGNFQEAVACSFMNAGTLQTIASMEDVKAAFLGHDHINDFCGDLDGVQFCYGGGFGYHGYGKVGWARRARVILAELGKGKTTWRGVERIKTWKRLDDEMLSKIDEQVLWTLQRHK